MTSREEINSPVSSQDLEEMMKHLDSNSDKDQVSNPKEDEPECKGNIATDCIINGLEALSSGGKDHDYVLYGGISDQLTALNQSSSLRLVMDNYGRRVTTDLDIMATNEDIDNLKEDIDALEEDSMPEFDIKDPYIPGSHEIIDNAQVIDFSQIHEDYDIQIALPQPEHLIYTKVYTDVDDKDGTRHDLLEIGERSRIIDYDEEELGRFIDQNSPDPQNSRNILRNHGFDY